MTRKKIFCVIVLISILLVVFTRAHLWSNTKINVVNVESDRGNKLTAWTNGTVYYYDASQKTIFSINDNGRKESVKEVVGFQCLAANQNNLYYVDEEYLYQYKISVNEWIRRKLEGVEIDKYLSVNQICADESYLYIQRGENIYIYSAEDICGKVDVFEEMDSQKRRRYIGVREYVNETCAVLFPQHNGEYTELAVIDPETGNKLIGDSYFLGKYDDASAHLEILGPLVIYEDFVGEKLYNGELLYGSQGGNYDLRCSYKAKEKLIIIASCYSYGYTANYGAISNHRGDNIWYVDLQKRKTVCNYESKEKEIVFFANENNYIIFKNGIIETYEIKSRKKLSENKADWFKKGAEHTIEVCCDKWFVFRDGQLIDIIPIEEYL